MKRIYLIGAALILFVGTGAYYLTNKPAKENDNEAYASAIGTQAPASAASNSGALPVNNQILPQECDNPGAAQGKDAAKDQSMTKYRRIKYAPVTAAQDAAPGAELTAYAQDNETGAETANDYYGNIVTPVSEKKTVIVRHAANDDESGCRICKIFNGRVGFGPEIGYGMNGLTSSPGNMITGGVNAGLVFKFNMGDNVAFEPALKYINKGTKYIDAEDPNINEKLTMHYLEVPADLVFKFGNPANTRFMIGAGPYVSYLLSAHDRFNTDQTYETGGINAGPQYPISSLEKIDWGVGGFLGCTSPDGMYAKAGAEFSMADLQQNSAYPGGVRNYNFLFSVGYLFGGNR